MTEELKQAVVTAYRDAPEDVRLPPASETDLLAFEAEFGPIPADFRWYLSACGGGPGASGEWLDGINELYRDAPAVP